MKYNINIGKIGENLALKYLKDKGYFLIEKNFYSRWGELDLVCRKDNKIIFVEVKTRIGDKKGKPYEAINSWKLRGLKRAINFYLLKNKLQNYKLLLDVVSIVLNGDLSLKELKHFENVEIK